MDEFFVGFKAAAEYCDMHKETLSYHRRAGHVSPDRMQGGVAIFYRSTLDEFIARHRNDSGMSKADIEREFGIARSVVQYHMEKMGLAPSHKNGNAWMFDRDEILAHFGMREAEPDDDTEAA